jgi:hypothetical protein
MYNKINLQQKVQTFHIQNNNYISMEFVSIKLSLKFIIDFTFNLFKENCQHGNDYN